jgi:hypothetical protein
MAGRRVARSSADANANGASARCWALLAALRMREASEPLAFACVTTVPGYSMFRLFMAIVRKYAYIYTHCCFLALLHVPVAGPSLLSNSFRRLLRVLRQCNLTRRLLGLLRWLPQQLTRRPLATLRFLWPWPQLAAPHFSQLQLSANSSQSESCVTTDSQSANPLGADHPSVARGQTVAGCRCGLPL